MNKQLTTQQFDNQLEERDFKAEYITELKDYIVLWQNDKDEENILKVIEAVIRVKHHNDTLTFNNAVALLHIVNEEKERLTAKKGNN